MIVNGAYQPMTTRLIDEAAEVEAAARELLTVEDLTTSARDQLDAVVEATVVLGNGLVQSLRSQPDSAQTFRALIGADRLLSRYRKKVLTCSANRGSITVDA